MMRGPGAFLLALLLAVPWCWTPGLDPAPRLSALATDVSCKVCHPGALRGLQHSRHQGLLDDPATRERACTVCHGDLTEHAAAAARPGERQPVPVPPVAASSCAVCHPGQGYATDRAAHPLPAAVERAHRVLPEVDAALLDRLEGRDQGTRFSWSGLVDLGYRLVAVSGSRARYQTDVDLEPGLRLRNFELVGAGEGGAFADELSLVAHDLGEPRWDVGARARADEAWSLDAGYSRDRFRYRATGDFHRVDRRSDEARYGAELFLSKNTLLFATFAQGSDQGFWLTQRIGNTNVLPQTVVDNVSSPRRAEVDDLEVGITTENGGLRYTAAVEYRDQRTRDRWTFSRPAPANPAFPESEDFATRSTLRGPGARLGLGKARGPVSFDLQGRYVERDFGLTSNGTGQGFDLSEFDSTLTATGDGDTRTWLGSGTITFELDDTLALVGDLSWRDHRENLHLRATEVFTFPTLATVTTVSTVADPDTSQRLLEGTVQLDWSPDETLDLSLGYGFAREWLRVPDLQPADNDFTRGTTRDDGVIAGARWQLAEAWTARGEVRAFGQDGVFLHELAPESTEEAKGSLGYAGERGHATAFVRHREVDNDVSDHRLRAFATGLTAGVQSGTLDLTATYSFARTRSRTLTNFYFDPDPNPQPTFVGWRGRTHTVTGVLGMQPGADVRWEITAAWTTTTGDFDVTMLDWRADVRWRVRPRGDVGIEFRQLRYDDSLGVDDWGAEMVFLYYRQEW